MISVKTSSGNVDISVPLVSQNTGKKLVSVGVKISGGADSALLAYMLAMYKKLYRPDIRLEAITCINAKKPYQAVYASKVLQKVMELTGVHFNTHHIKDIPGDNYGEEQHEFLMSLYDGEIIDCHFMGETWNPPVDIEELQTHDRPTARDMPAPTRVSDSFRPFRMIHKRNIAELYAHYNLTDTLFPMTRSCEHLSTDISELTEHCGTCWFCLERNWGFGRLI